MTYLSEIRLARAALSRIIEPSDLIGMALIQAAGPEEAMAFIRSEAATSSTLEAAMTPILADAGTSTWAGLREATERWRPRLKGLSPERDLMVIERLGGGLVIPEDPWWPAALADLQLTEPMALWMRGCPVRIPDQGKCIAIVGSRDSTNYGATVAGEMAASLVQQGFTVISGGAYGIDAHAHRGALGLTDYQQKESGLPPTLAVMAGGIDRFYPSGNEDLLRQVLAEGAMIAEVPPGANPTRYRFLQRNRIIAALCQVTVVVEARWRSGALNTAHHAEGLSRNVGAVPGSVYSANSAGCHRLLREGAATCVSDAGDVAELAGETGSFLLAEVRQEKLVHDDLPVEDLLLLDALPVRSSTTVDKLSVVAGLATTSVMAGLGRLELAGLATRTSSGWQRGKVI